MSGQKINDMKCKQCGYAHPIGTACPAGSSFAAPSGSANASPAKEALKKEMARIIDDAFTAGFDADNAGALDHFDGFALAEAAIEKHWPNNRTERPAGHASSSQPKETNGL